MILPGGTNPSRLCFILLHVRFFMDRFRCFFFIFFWMLLESRKVLVKLRKIDLKYCVVIYMDLNLVFDNTFTK